MTETVVGDPADAFQARQLQDDLRGEMDRLVEFIAKIEFSIRQTSSSGHAGWLHSQRDRQSTELSRLGRTVQALETRFRI